MIPAYDVAILGAGIHGACLAEAAAADGYTVAVLEREFPGYGTSSRSSKLIHGGLRYLETGNLGLVRESLRERSILLQRAPELVHLERFYVPLYRHSRHRPWQLRMGLSLYSLLGGLRSVNRFALVPRRRWDTLDGLNTEGLQAVFSYFDAQTNDRALTAATLRSAEELGADCLVPARFTGAGRLATGWQVNYEHRGETAALTARALFNATGPWINQTQALIRGAPPALPMDLVQGTHVVLDAHLGRGIYYVEAEDARGVFLMPWGERTLVGTTETPFDGNPDAAEPLAGEVDYLLRAANAHFPRLAAAPVAEAFAGLRVLPTAEEGLHARSRESRFLVDDTDRPTLLSLYGGKLTAARATAEKALARLTPELPRRRPRDDTRTRQLRALTSAPGIHATE